MKESMIYDGEMHVVKLPIGIIGKIIRDAMSGPITEECDSACMVSNALVSLQYEWSVVYLEKGGRIRAAGFCEYGDCAKFVATQYGTDVEVLYVLKCGVPRKNVRVQVKARL